MDNGGRLRAAIEKFIASTNLGNVFWGGIKKRWEALEVDGYAYLQALYAKLGITGKIPFGLENNSGGGVIKHAQYDLLTIVGLVIGFLIAAVQAVTRPLSTIEEYKLQHMYRTQRIPIDQAIKGYWRDKSFEELLTNDLADSGWDTDRTHILTELSRPRLGIGELLEYYKRGFMPLSDMVAELVKRGWLPEEVGAIVNLSDKIPAPGDLVNMAVREAWNPDVISRFKYLEDLPSEFVEWMGKQGYTPEWAQKFWSSHWQVPGLSTGYEMLHRLRPGTTSNPFTLEDMRTLIKTADYPAFFRDRLVEISYSPYARVDVRRMYNLGVLTEADVKANYLDLGYDDEHAQKLTDFTVQDSTSEQKGLTRGLVTSLYEQGSISRDQALDMLHTIGILADNAEWWLGLSDAQQDQQEQAEVLKDIQSRYVNRELDDVSIYSALGPLGLPTDRQNRLLHLWSVQRQAKIHKPTVAVLEKWYKSGLIGQDDLKAGILRDGYLDSDALLYIAQLDLDIQAAAAKEQASAQTEADRQTASKSARDITKQLAVFDAQIAQDRLELANIAVALHTNLSQADIDSLNQAKDALNVDIAQINLYKAQLKD